MLDLSKLEILHPPRPYSWQTLFWLSVFSGFMAFLATGFFRTLIAVIGQILLIISITWLGKINNFFPILWITSALICGLLYGLFKIQPSVLCILWLPLAAILIILDVCFSKDLTFKVPNTSERHTLLILFLTQVLMACWLQFTLITYNWIQSYPSLLTDQLNHSNFIVNLTPRQPPRSVAILQTMRQQLIETLNNKPWTEGESWLKNSAFHIQEMYETFLSNLAEESETKNNLQYQPSLPENQFWKLYFLYPLEQNTQQIYTFRYCNHPQCPPIKQWSSYTVSSFPSDDPWFMESLEVLPENEYRLLFRMEWTGPQSNQSQDTQPYQSHLNCKVFPIGNSPQQTKIQCPAVY
ncbi:DUF5357 family protein [Spirulina sp. CS-785/01]|uniref:DUF5357 family protein n=1 Tax=Spirulina sp. CS-785/01 TaxID=3021716 RepID=UPI00232FCD23|nr:DUF5357 family protein [Spirulina sp. CS-785/01]MDB9313015.1 DUF5357 family protein [Spirulina sp. CS-785/01]